MGQPTITYTYDDAGNRTGISGTGISKSYTPDDDNRLTQLVDNGVTTTYAYDKNGSMTGKTTGGTTTAYTYDGARKMTNVSVGGTSQASFAYDGDGNRKSKTTPAGTTTYVNDTRGMSQVLQETRPGSVTLSYVPGVSQNDPSQAGNAQWAYFHQDAQNNRVLTNAVAAVSQRTDYDPFGVVRATSGTAASAFGYAGEEKDGETGLVYLRARYFDPATGRFLARDVMPGHPGFPQAFNRYAYALNNPIRWVDPSGYEADDNSCFACHGIPGMEPNDLRNLREMRARVDNRTPQFRDVFEAAEYIWGHYFINVAFYENEDPEHKHVNFSLTELQAVAKTLDIMALELGDPKKDGGRATLRKLIGTDKYSLVLERGSANSVFGRIEAPDGSIGAYGTTGTRFSMDYDDSGSSSWVDEWKARFLALGGTASMPLVIRLYDNAFKPGGLEFTFAHELGHVVDIRKNFSLSSEYFRSPNSGPVLLGDENHSKESEMFPDAFANWFFEGSSFAIARYGTASGYETHAGLVLQRRFAEAVEVD